MTGEGVFHFVSRVWSTEHGAWDLALAAAAEAHLQQVECLTIRRLSPINTGYGYLELASSWIVLGVSGPCVYECTCARTHALLIHHRCPALPHDLTDAITSLPSSWGNNVHPCLAPGRAYAGTSLAAPRERAGQSLQARACQTQGHGCSGLPLLGVPLGIHYPVRAQRRRQMSVLLLAGWWRERRSSCLPPLPRLHHSSL